MLDAEFQGKLCGIAFALLKSGVAQKDILQGMIAIQTNAAQLAAPVAAQPKSKQPMLDEFLRSADAAGITALPITFDDASQPAQGERQPEPRHVLADGYVESRIAAGDRKVYGYPD